MSGPSSWWSHSFARARRARGAARLRRSVIKHVRNTKPRRGLTVRYLADGFSSYTTAADSLGAAAPPVVAAATAAATRSAETGLADNMMAAVGGGGRGGRLERARGMVANGSGAAAAAAPATTTTSATVAEIERAAEQLCDLVLVDGEETPLQAIVLEELSKALGAATRSTAR